MHRSSRNVLAVAAVLAAAGLGLPGLAQAASPSVQLELCNNESQAGTFEITGRNQHNARVSSPLTDIGGRRCKIIANWWWKTDQVVSVAVRRNSLNLQEFYIGPNERNDSTVRFWIQ